MEKLTSMTEFVLEYSKDWFKEMDKNRGMLRVVYLYAKFLSRPINIGMFVPAIQREDGTWEVLESPEFIHPEYGEWNINKLSPAGKEWSDWYNECKQFQQAQSRVLFEGFIPELNHSKHITDDTIIEFHGVDCNVNIHVFMDYESGIPSWETHDEKPLDYIEDLVKYKPTLTEAAKRQIGVG